MLLGCVYVAALTGEPLAITWQVLALVGIAGTGSLAARFVSITQERTPVLTNEHAPHFRDLFKTDGVLDLYKLQMFVFTVFTAGFVIARIIIDKAFPVLDENLLLLLGISNGIYVGSKVAGGDTPLRKVEQLDIDLKVLQEAKIQADAEVDRLKAKIKPLDDAIKKLDDELALLATTDPKKGVAETQKKELERERKVPAAQLQAAEAKTVALQNQIEGATKARQDLISKL